MNKYRKCSLKQLHWSVENKCCNGSEQQKKITALKNKAVKLLLIHKKDATYAVTEALRI